MSNFGGITREFKRISIDRFDGINLESTLYVLSHFHSDRAVGLASELFKQRICSNPEIRVYCSVVTKNLILLEETYSFLKDAIVPLVENVPFQLFIPVLREGNSRDAIKLDHEEEMVTLTLLPAGHCPGSTMCLIEGSKGKVLYTGDCRISSEHLKLLQSIFVSEGRPKHLDSLYVDTTFFHPSNSFIPSRSYSLVCATEVIGHWIGQGKPRVVCLKFKASLGCEHLLYAISKHFNMKIHVNDFKFNQCQNIANVSDFFTTDPDATQIHACDLFQQRTTTSEASCPCNVLKDVHAENLRTIIFSAMFFTHAMTPDRYCIPVGKNDFRICYSLHPSYSEVCQLIEILKPDKAYASVTKLGGKIPKSYDVQQELDRVVKQAQNSSPNNFSNSWDQAEKRLKRQFSEDSLDNFLFDDTRSYLKNSKRPRLEAHDLSAADILEVNQGKGTECTGVASSPGNTIEHSWKRKRDFFEEAFLSEGTNGDGQSFLPRSKKFALQRRVLQEHIRRCESQNGFFVKGQESSLCPSDYESDSDSYKSNEEKICISTINEDIGDRVVNNNIPDAVEVKGCNDACSEEILPDAFDVLFPSGNSCKFISQPDNSRQVCSQSSDSCIFITHSENPQQKLTSLIKEGKQNNEMMINLCNDDDQSDIESKKEIPSDVLLDSDVTVELNSSFDVIDGTNTSTKYLQNSSTKVFLSTKSSPQVIETLPSIPEEKSNGKINIKATAASQPSSVLSLDCDIVENHESENSIAFDQRVVCIDLTDDFDEEDDEDYDEESSGGPRLSHLHRCSIKMNENEDYEDERGYDGGDECESPEWMGTRKDVACHQEENPATEDEAKAVELASIECQEDDSNDRTSGYDSDTPHLTELQRKSHARFEKLYKRKQRKIKLKTRRQNLRNVAKDDIIIIDDDTSDTEDSYDYDSDFSSSDYNHYPGRARSSKSHRGTDDAEQFLMPSMSSSSESSQTLSSEDDDNVVVVVNCTKSAEGEEDEKEIVNGEGMGLSLDQE